MSLQADALNALFSNATDEQKLDVVVRLCEKIPPDLFFQHGLITSKLKQRICDTIVELASQDDVEFLVYLFKHSDMSFNTLHPFLDRDFLYDMMSCVRPSKWKKSFNDGFVLLVSSQTFDEDNVLWKEFDFRRDIIDARFPPLRIRRSVLVGRRQFRWYEF